MRSAETVVFALRALGETGQSATLTQGANAVAPFCENLVRLGLMPDVPDDTVGGRIKNMMYCNRQFNDTKTGAEVTTSYRNRADRFGAQFCRNLRQVAFLHLPKVSR